MINKIFLVVITMALVVTGYFFYQNQKLSAELSILKNTDLAKEVATLKFKLRSVEDVLTLEKREHGDTKNQLTTAEGRVKTLEATIKQVRPYVNVLTAFDDWQRPTGLHILDRDTSQIDSAVSALGDNEVSDLWQEVKANFSRAKQTGDFRDNEVPVLITQKLARLLK
ncbi:MAG: hypothetical protein HYW77_00405 [Parcubacteria group bacterium]|nr:hypothetical protein [Parcubacteria group bacterium]